MTFVIEERRWNVVLWSIDEKYIVFPSLSFGVRAVTRTRRASAGGGEDDGMRSLPRILLVKICVSPP